MVTAVIPTTQPITDRYGRVHDYLRVSLTDRCNLRCAYCMPETDVNFAPKHEILTLEEILKLVKLFANLGVRKIRLTGGEPTIRPGYIDLIAQVKAIPGIEHVALTTNGLKLAAEAEQLKQAGLDSLNVSLDTLNPERFTSLTRRPGHAKVLSGIQAALHAGLETKINVVLLRGFNEDEIEAFLALAQLNRLTVRFIEFMPFLGNEWGPERVVPNAEIRDRVQAFATLKPIPGEPSDVATSYQIEGFQGQVGFISSVTESFCAGCNRIRLTADGMLKTCLFLPPAKSLRDLLRQGVPVTEIEATIREGMLTKWAGHPPMRTWQQLDQLSMVQIGG